MIDYVEIGMLLGLAAARDQRTVGDADNLAWHDDLNTAGISYDDAKAAITRFYAVEMAGVEPDERRRVTTPDVINLAKKIRNARLENFLYEPPPGDSDPHYLARRRSQISDVVDGRQASLAIMPPMEGGPAPEVLAKLAGIGVHPDLFEDGAEEEAPDKAPSVKRPGPFGVACPTCHVPIGRPCRAPSRNGKPGREKPPHNARKVLATGGQLTDPAAEQAEIERRRAASALRLQQLAEFERTQAGPEIHDIEIVEPEGDAA
ncbi:zinc finger domain-containing protein [Streptomyces goshikiensis]|uniref:zinc finger domain-containing protein n=1 Tax=Streptomyces goshikiensis TaxID=1942 RepID=UPI0037196334